MFVIFKSSSTLKKRVCKSLGYFFERETVFNQMPISKEKKNMSKFAKDELKKCTFLDMELYSQKLSYFNHLPKINPVVSKLLPKSQLFASGKKKNCFFLQSQNYLKWPQGLSLKHRNFSFLSYG